MNFSPSAKHIIVNYHYVEDPRDDRRGIYPCSVGEFARQIDFLSQNYSFVSIPEVYQAVKSGLEKKLCAITFDDGMKDQYENTISILRRHKARATFFPITCTLSGTMPNAHKIHILLSKISSDSLIDQYNELEPANKILKEQRTTDKRMHEDIPTANFKEAMILLSDDARARFLNQIFSRFFLDEKLLCKEIFMCEEELADLNSSGFFVENHTHSHESLENQNDGFLCKDFRESQNILADILGRRPTIMSYPHGRANDRVINILRQEGFTHGVTIETRAVQPEDDSFFLPRFDTNDIKRFLNIQTVPKLSS